MITAFNFPWFVWRKGSKFILALVVSASVAAADEADPPRLLVVGPDALRPSLANFITWKQSLLPTDWVSLQEILSSSSGVDDPEKLKRWIHQKWREDEVTHVLLVGDVDVMPTRYMVLDRKTDAAFNYAFYPSDHYYADLAKADRSFEDWNARKDGFHAAYFGEVRGEHHKTDAINFDEVDYTPEIAVGRWPASTAAEVERIAAKSIAYEQRILADDRPGPHRAAWVAVGGWVDTRPLLNGLAEKLAKAWRIDKRLYGTDSPPPDADQIVELLNQGTDLVLHTGHGIPERWEESLSIADIARLTHRSRVPVMMSASCSTAHFAPLPPYEPYTDAEGNFHQGTYQGEVFTAPPSPPSPLQKGAVNPTSLAEELLKVEDTGCVAYIGCNTGSQPFGLTLMDGFVRELATAENPRLGDCWNSAIRHYLAEQNVEGLQPTDSWVPPSIFFQAMKFMVFGDPSLRLPGQEVR